MGRKKINVKKLLADLLGYGTGIAASGFWTCLHYNIYKYGEITFYERNPIISLIETGFSLFGVSFFSYKLIKMIVDYKKYLKKSK